MLTSKLAGLIAKALILCLIYYVIIFFIIFNLNTRASNFESETIWINGSEMTVAIGPKPHLLFCRPFSDGLYYSSNQWPFIVYGLFCKIWSKRNGYALPIESD